ncbi:hypothetical protein DPEC_G00172880 [Dallia pectoralis]|uniref:Uncharacterized protein n=1 Tax=Dallia pectoralis TaxID=75939 RepID=A0ACC2GE04_DALPE|nr:hypothetical protein DPEC_G00172880 [Dallia pectoralis]
MEESRDQERTFRRPSGSRGKSFFSPDRKALFEGSLQAQADGVSQQPYRYYERGHPLPNYHSPEPKASIPYRNVNLGIPSQRRSDDTFLQETWRSESPQRYTYHSNFRRGGAESRNQSPSKTRSPSPSRSKPAESRSASSRRRDSRSRNCAPHDSSSRHQSGHSSPSHRQGSVLSQHLSPPRNAPSYRHADSSHRGNGASERSINGSDRHSRVSPGSAGSRRPSHNSNGHSLDSETLYKNLDQISHRGSTAFQAKSYESSRSPRPRTGTNPSPATRSWASKDGSPSRTSYGAQSHSPQRETVHREARPESTRSYSRKPERDVRNDRPDRNTKTDCSPRQGSWHGSSRSLSPAPSRSSSPPRLGVDSQLLANSLKPHAAIAETDHRPIGDRSKSTIRRGLEYLLTREEPKRTASVDSQGMTIEDYVILADIPRPEKGFDREDEELVMSKRRRAQSPSPRRDHSHRTTRYAEESEGYSVRVDSDERGRGRERGRDRREKERMTCADSDDGSTTARQRQWRRHWFVMSDAALSFYRDSEAEESHDLDGEIDLADCVNVLDVDVDKNFGFQIHAKEAVLTLSASTSRIRRSWVKVLRQAIQRPDASLETPRKPYANGDKQHGYRPPAPAHRPPSSTPREEPGHRTPNSASRAPGMDSVDLDRMPSDMRVANRREEAEGWDREQAKRLEERNRWFEEGISFSERGSRWESLELKTGGVPRAVTHAMDVDVSRKWAEFESLSFRELSALSLIDAQTNQCIETIPNEGIQSSAAAQQREALSRWQQVKGLRKERIKMGMEVESSSGPEAPSGQFLEAMDEVPSLMENQESHKRQVREMQAERARRLQEESTATTQVEEALNRAYREERVGEVEKAWSMAGSQTRVDITYNGQPRPRAEASNSELDVLSERYSQKCLELSRVEQSGKDREMELNRMEREMELLCKENKELQARLTEEISRMRRFISGQRSACVSPGNRECSPSQLETLLRAKENEVENLQKEVSGLRKEVQSLTMEKQSGWDAYKEVYEEFSATKDRYELEIRNLKENLRLANAALYEGGGVTRESVDRSLDN